MEKTYYKHKLENFLIIQKIVIVHYLEADKRFSFPEEAHNFWELVYADKESVVCSADGQEIVLEEGEILFHKPNERHSLRANGKTAPNIFIVSFECKNEAMRFFENKRLRLNKRLLRFVYRIIEESKKTFDLPYSDPALKKMKLRKKPPIGGQQLIKNYLEILLIDLMRDETEKEDSEIVFLQKNERDGYVSKRVVSYLREHIRENVGVSDICNALNYNKSYLFQQFTADIGMPI
ncbi:MAG: AraC family ligand binding domain-containing protein, partial [Clostridia bacterium]|nr:AraC family ligand binding domain-containing protein [Clostridia bacterium]